MSEKEIVFENCSEIKTKTIWEINHNCIASVFETITEEDLDNPDFLPLRCKVCNKILVREFTEKDNLDKNIRSIK